MNKRELLLIILFVSIAVIGVVTSFDGSELDDVCDKNGNILRRISGNWVCSDPNDFVDYVDIINEVTINVTNNITQSGLNASVLFDEHWLNLTGGTLTGDLVINNTFPGFQLIDSDAPTGGSYGWFRAWYNPGTESGFDIDAMTEEGDDTSYFRFFRYVDTTGPALIRVMTGEGSNTPNIQLGGKGVNTYFNALNGNTIIGGDTSIGDNRLTIEGNQIINGNLTLGGTMTGDVAWKISPSLFYTNRITETNYTTNTTNMELEYTANVSETDYNATIVYDSSGNNNDMTITNALTGSSYGYIEDGMGFNGIDTIIKVQNPSYIPRDNTDDYSMAAWVKYNSVTSGAVPWGYVSSISGVEIQSYIITYSGKMRWVIRADDGSSYNVYGAANVNVGEWYFIAVVKNGTSYKLYRNGEVDGSNTFDMSGETFTNRNYFTVGASYDNFVTTNWFNGSVDEVRVWNRSIAEQEIRLMYDENITEEYNQYDLSFFWNGTERIRFRTNGTEYSSDVYAYDFLSISDTKEKEDIEKYDVNITDMIQRDTIKYKLKKDKNTQRYGLNSTQWPECERATDGVNHLYLECVIGLQNARIAALEKEVYKLKDDAK